jgi:hypothetical protein
MNGSHISGCCFSAAFIQVVPAFWKPMHKKSIMKISFSSKENIRLKISGCDQG